MHKNKKWVIANRISYITLLLLSIVYAIVNRYYNYNLYLYILDISLMIVFIVGTLFSFTLKFVDYHYKNIKISVFAGYSSFILYVNDVNVSSLENMYFKPHLELNYINFDDKIDCNNITVKICPINHVEVLVDNHKILRHYK